MDLAFVSLGLVVLDELRFPGKKPLSDVMGGSASYSTFGARLFAKNEMSTSIGCLVLAGKDFPEQVEKRLKEWKMTLVLKKDLNRLSTRGLLEYEDTTFGPKKFKYTTEPLKPSPSDLPPSLLQSQAFHFLSKPEEITCQVDELLELRTQNGVKTRPLLVWEPFPAACQPKNLDFDLDCLQIGSDPDEFQPEVLESYAKKFLDHSIGPEGKGCIVIRAGEHGSLSVDTSRVIDATGAGNTFIGGFAIGLQQNMALDKAAAYGNVAASFAVEQIGLPVYKVHGLVETWNGATVEERLKEYNERLKRAEKGGNI